MAQAVSRRHPTAVVWVCAQVNPAGFVVDKVSLGQVFSEFLGFPLLISFHRGLHISEKLKKNSSFIHSPLHSSSSGDGQKARKSGRSPVRRVSHPYNQNTEYLVG
jgi:hypothetical protein